MRERPENEHERVLRTFNRAHEASKRTAWERTDDGGEKRDEKRGKPKQNRLTWLIPLGVISVLVLLYFIWPGYQNFMNEAYRVVRSGSRTELSNWVGGFGAWGPLLIYALMVTQTLLAFIPSLVVTVVPVLIYGPLWGGLLAWSGLLLAAGVAYGIGRALGPVTVERFIGHRTEKTVADFVEHYGVWGIIAARVSPALSTDAVSFVAGLVKMGFVRFLVATALGTLPLVALISFLGRNVETLWSGLLWVSLVSLAAFIAYVVWDRRRRGRG